MKKILILFLAALILFSGCIGEKTVKKGDTVSVNYTGSLQDGKVFDTNIESVAKQHDIIKPEYVPSKFKVGEQSMIEGFDEGVVGMKVGETRTLTIPPEKGYGLVDPELINTYDIIENVSARENTFPRIFDISLDQFETEYGPGHNKSDTVPYPGTNINLTVENITGSVSLSYDLKVGFQIFSQNSPWNMTVIKINETNVTIKPSVKKNDTVRFPIDQFQKTPWTSTVIGVTDDNITLRHNPIPETKVQSMFGTMVVRFNETSLIIDQNHELAGKTLIFNVTLVSIENNDISDKTPDMGGNK
ncbi:MAG: FKBP-type peptidyl-prolyl cis-trans isomerase [Euryarchaeota archaeon]|nr:FKBP-type peptidyl-prolyl cis-trans isomerase [Euryarchaeota archaeon]